MITEENFDNITDGKFSRLKRELQVTELSLLRCYVLRVRKKIPHALYIHEQ